MADNHGQNPAPLDRFGFSEVFANHLDLALTHMHPLEAIKAASAAVASYGNSYGYVEVGRNDDGTPIYKMVAKRQERG